MKTPTSDDCKRLARHYGCDCVLVLCVDSASLEIAGASWGADEHLCNVMGGVLDDMVDDLEDNRIGDPPKTFEQRSRR